MASFRLRQRTLQNDNVYNSVILQLNIEYRFLFIRATADRQLYGQLTCPRTENQSQTFYLIIKKKNLHDNITGRQNGARRTYEWFTMEKINKSCLFFNGWLQRIAEL